MLARRSGRPRAAARDALRAGSVTVDGDPVRPGHRLVEGESVRGTIDPPAATSPAAEAIALTVLYEDDRVLVVDKPAGLVTHPAGGHETGTLVNALLAMGVAPDAGDRARPGIVHRLDRDTSGAVLAAKDAAAHAFLAARMKERAVTRIYLALVRGCPGTGAGTVEAPVGRHPARRTRMAVVSSGRPSVTHFEVLERGRDAGLLRIRLETGRTHQIRVHMSHIGHPVLGDRSYGGFSDVSAGLGLDRPFLHAWKLSFPHPDDGRAIEVTAPLAADLRSVLARAGFREPA